MRKELKGTSELALAVEHLPVRARICVILMAADLALKPLKSSPNFPIAREAVRLVWRWHDGEPIHPDAIMDALQNERDEGVGVCEYQAKSKVESSAWLILESALLYTAFHAYRAIGEYPSPEASEVDETLLDHVDKWLRAISPMSIKTVLKGAEYLERDPNMSFSQLKSEVSKA